MNDMAIRGTKRSRSAMGSRPRKVFRKSSRVKRRFTGKRKSSARKGGFAKRVKRSLYRLAESKAIVCYLPTVAGGTPIMNFKGKQMTMVSVNPLASLTSPYNMLQRWVPAGTTFPLIGGDPGTLIATTGRMYGDTALGNQMVPTFLRVRGEFRSTIWSPPSKTRLLLVLGNSGDAPTGSTLWKNQCNNSFLDELNYPRYKLIAQYDFKLGGVSYAGNKNCDEHKPGGTGADNSTGTYWNAEGVAVPSDPQEATMTENVVNFNGAASMECLAPKVHIMDWKVPLAKVGTVHYDGGTYQSAGYVTATSTNKEKGLWLVAYNYANNLQGSNEQHANVIVDELHWKLYFKDV